MMFRWITQPGIQKLWNFCGHYQDVYDWISPLNKPSDLWFILTQQSMGEIIMVNPVTCLFSLHWSTFDAFKEQFSQGFILHLIKDTDSIYYRDIQLKYFKVETLLNNASNCRRKKVIVSSLPRGKSVIVVQLKNLVVQFVGAGGVMDKITFCSTPLYKGYITFFSFHHSIFVEETLLRCTGNEWLGKWTNTTPAMLKLVLSCWQVWWSISSSQIHRNHNHLKEL